jgi:hypothetical protein
MRTLRVVSVAGVTVLTAVIFLGLTFFLRAQTQLLNGSTALPDNQPDSVVRIVADSQGLQLVQLEQLPKAGTFWVAGSNGLSFPVPYPCPPPGAPNAIFYALGPEGEFLVDVSGGAVPHNQPHGKRRLA